MEGYAYVECADCAFVFAPAVTEETATRHYVRPREDTPPGGWATREFVEVALSRLPRTPGLPVLDLGAGESELPDTLRSEGYRVIEVDPVARVSGGNHPDRIVGSLVSATLPTACVALAYSFQVFEHVPEPRRILDELLRVTLPGGLVLVHTDMEVPEREEEGFESWWYVMPPEHCSLYRHRTFERFARQSGSAIVYRDEKTVLIRTSEEQSSRPRGGGRP